MEEKKGNIFTSHSEVLQKTDKESLLKQRAMTLWLTGLSGSGKSTIAQRVERMLHSKGFLVMLLDGDNVRDGLNKNLGFTKDGRTENIRRVAEVNKLFNSCGVITINAFVSPTQEIRDLAKDIIGKENYLEIYVNTSLEVCESRDVKGLYKKARAGEILNFTGIDSPYEAPESADFTLHTDSDDQDQSAQKLVEYIIPKILLN